MLISQLQKYKKILILGYGVEGRETEKFLKKHYPQSDIIIADQKENPSYLDLQESSDLVIRTPSLSTNLIKKPYTTATNIFFANCPAKIIGITGTKGKSTTAAIIDHILKKAGYSSYLVGNIGIPMLSIVDKLKPEDWVVTELSSYQLEDINYSPHIGIITNIYYEHIDHHQTYNQYFKSKERIVGFSSENDYYIYLADNLLLKYVKTKAIKISVDRLPDNFNQGQLIGTHNRDNLSLAHTAALLLKIDEETIQKAVNDFTPLNHRLTNIGTFKNITFIDDASSSNPESTIAALDCLTNIGTLFLGGLDRGYDFSVLIKKAADMKIDNLILFPDTDKKLKAELRKYSDYYPKILVTSEMKQAVEFAYSHTSDGKICLLSTGAPSYSVFKDFNEKGELFSKWVRKLS